MKAIKKIYLALVFLFLYAPIAVLIFFSFNASRTRGHWGGFTLRWYRELFNDPEILRALYNTLSVALFSSFISVLIGTVAAICIFNLRSVVKNIVLHITKIPLANPDIVTGVSLMILYVFVFHFFKFGNFGYWTLLLSHIAFNVPYVIFSVLPRLQHLNSNIFEAALDLGASPSYALRKIILPEIMPAVLTGFLLAFTLSIDDFVVSFFTSGSGVNNLSILIYSMARRGINPKINALSSLMFLCVIVLLYLVNKRDIVFSKLENNQGDNENEI